MFFKKEITNNSLLTAIDNGSLDNILGGGKLLSERDVTSESDKEVIRRINEKRDRDAEDR